jgi:hypothetical protein
VRAISKATGIESSSSTSAHFLNCMNAKKMSLMVMRISLTTHLFSAAFLRSLWYKIAAKIRMLSNNSRQPAPMVAASAVVKLGYDDFVFFLQHEREAQNYP